LPAVGLRRYQESTKPNTKSSITLPAEELRLVQSLKARLKLRSNVEVVRRGLRLLQDATERRALRDAYRTASQATREALAREIEDLDHLAGEGLD
jgi:Arc/MetJ-type ribon-helix-helix transcriptional regulator